MKVSYLWLKDYCDFDLTPQQLADGLSQRGLACEGLEAVGEDFCLDLEVTANRPDLLSHIGVAREIAAMVGSRLRIPEVNLREEDQPVERLARVEVHDPQLCPRYTARVVYDVEVGPSPVEMQRRLQTVGLRPINNIVDITNYVMLECGQPEHAFDFEKIEGRTVVVRPAAEGEKLVLIDQSEVELNTSNLVIADHGRPVALAGVMGGLQSEISDGTRVVLLESAKFDPVNIRRTSRSLGKSSDSSYRFERGVDTPTVEWASRRAAALMRELAGGKVARGVLDIDFTSEEPRSIVLRIPRIERVLGMPVSLTEAGKHLKSIGFSVRAEGHDRLVVGVPSFRQDVEQEIDLIEEVARCHGYEKVPAASSLRIRAVSDSKFDQVVREARGVLVRLGYHEAVTTSFASVEMAQEFSPWNKAEPITLSNPLRSDQSALRTSLLPALLEAARVSQGHGVEAVRLFEVNRVFLRRPGGQALPEERTCVAVVANEDFAETKGTVETLLERLGVTTNLSFEEVDHSFLNPGLAGHWRIGTSVLGYLGELSEEAAERFHLHAAPMVAELDMEVLSAAAHLEGRFRPLPRFPAVERDLAVVVDERVTWREIEETVRGAGAEHLEAVSFGEVYRGKQIEAGKKSVFFRLSYRAPDRTLTSEEVNASQERVVAALAEALGARLRD